MRAWAMLQQWSDSWCSRLGIVVDQAFGLLWCRMIFAHQSLDKRAADDLAAALATQLGANQEG
ncbi:MAG TPA: hypothetical protein VFI55_13865 [Mycobacterium sp.]|nr:hypothetical protein [Mycobacterium sp.]